jgi:hypothetical protein
VQDEDEKHSSSPSRYRSPFSIRLARIMGWYMTV